MKLKLATRIYICSFIVIFGLIIFYHQYNIDSINKKEKEQKEAIRIQSWEKAHQEAEDALHYGELHPNEPYSDGKEVLSPNGELSVFVQNYPDRPSFKLNEIWIRDKKNHTEKLLVGNMFENDVLCDFSSIVFSFDAKKIYFNNYNDGQNDEIYVADISTGVLKDISVGDPFDVITKGVYKGKLFTSKHKYYEEGGSYDHWYIIDENDGHEIKDLGESTPLEKLKEEYGLLHLFSELNSE
ncbi:MAG: hypothetical protein PHE59_00295 [Patescibacteria group bacterium]|nr:hypothetical protein [Patescibacteria group bacterium]MDD5164446.1 hypothetical protein [Patescibacteria group bacterium]MDD5534365.1 hypothetical protein [Patescibacteria group bacterium]